MSKQIIQYEIIPNQLSGGKTFRGIIHHQRVLNNAALVSEIVKRNTTVSRQEAVAVIDLYEELIKEHLGRGYTITTGLFRADISLTGEFKNRSDKIDYKRHKAKVILRPAIKLNKEVCDGLRFHKLRDNRNSNYISYITELGDTLPSGTIRSGGVMRISGKGLKNYKHENQYELTLREAQENGQIIPKGKTHSLRILTVTNGKITAFVPPAVTPGRYGLVLKHRYGSVDRVFPAEPLTVIGE
jgi:hypothetical protein